ncbi:MAG: glutamate--tRNA ligase [Methanosarcinaceae archaeon]
MINKEIRLRFAPSPTGFLHIGSLRTVLFNYLIAKSLNGKFILRIEDTDQKRKIEGAEEGLAKTLNWLNLKFDEGPAIINNSSNDNKKDIGNFGPYIQTKRLSIYKKYSDQLIKEGKAYRCFCSPERLTEMREKQQKNKLSPRYDMTCRDLRDKEVKKMLADGRSYVIRQKMPLKGNVIVNDELRGDIKFKAEDLEDHILIKSNGIPTYQFAVVVDDYLMKISHVVRGEEWIPSLPKNILLYKNFGWEPPKFIHMPLTLNKEGGKLSKRQGDISVEYYKTKGYLPEALINFSILQGWSPYAKIKKNKNIEIMKLNEIAKIFDYKDMSISSAIFDIEKLDYFNGYYIRNMKSDKLIKLCKPYLKKYWKNKGGFKNPFKISISNVIKLEQERLKQLDEIGELTKFFFIDKLKYPAKLLIWKKLSLKDVKNNLKQILVQLEKIPKEKWTKKYLEKNLIDYIKSKNAKIGDYLWPMRVSLTGEKASLGPFEVAWILRKKESLNKIKIATKIN